MPGEVSLNVYKTLKSDIEKEVYAYQSLLPSESELTHRFGCSRSSVRSAITQLVADGYVQPLKGKGVRLIRNPQTEGDRRLGGIETFKEMARRRGFEPLTKTIVFEDVVANEALAKVTGFKLGSDLKHIVRVRHADGTAVGTDESYYLASEVAGLTPQIVDNSIYEYLENVLGMQIVTSKRTVTVEAINAMDQENLALDGFNAVAVIRSSAFDTNGILVEYTETRQLPGFFSLDETLVRRRV